MFPMSMRNIAGHAGFLEKSIFSEPRFGTQTDQKILGIKN